MIVPPPGRLVRLGVVLPLHPDAAAHVAMLAGLAGIDVAWAANEAQAVLIRRNVTSTVVEVLPPRDEPWSRTIAISPGRTRIEAAARFDLDPRLQQYPVSDRAVGSLEDCQAIVARLSAEGVTDLRCVLPDTPDVHDVIAQLTAIAIV
jgi:hypothetical protein